MDHVAKRTFAQPGKAERAAKNIAANAVNVTITDAFWHFHKFNTGTQRNPSIANIKNGFKKGPEGFKGGTALKLQHIAPINDSVFIQGNIDLFLTETTSLLSDAVQEEVADQLTN